MSEMKLRGRRPQRRFTDVQYWRGNIDMIGLIVGEGDGGRQEMKAGDPLWGPEKKVFGVFYDE